ncbi:concanavalin A-like lectin/glucanase domain-containing protein [Gigaspora rosea]|uniref:Concanavalin A-like lectin/glucanase domain-containing protein n=1 Tax=Gigaspora rosea TaxID=44941 RepID=A0A397VKL6_9GLOM|nr:concanavalin A-like lectin/glucanase domain-containing protein [Gigaspora rosea]
MQTSSKNVGTASGKGELEQFLPDYLKDSLRKLDNPIPIPTCWNVNDCSPDLKIDDNLLSVRYNGTRIAAAVRANNWIPEEIGVYYFEVDILDGGDGDLISVGVATLDFALARHVGWDFGSRGYHGDDGLKFLEQGFGSRYGPTYTTGDTIGCCINFDSTAICFTKNGINLGYACSFYDDTELYPAIGMRSRNARVEANFGNRPFKFDIKLYIETLSQQDLNNLNSQQDFNFFLE